MRAFESLWRYLKVSKSSVWQSLSILQCVQLLASRIHDYDSLQSRLQWMKESDREIVLNFFVPNSIRI